MCTIFTFTGPSNELTLPNLLNLTLKKSAASIVNIPQMIEQEKFQWCLAGELLGSNPPIYPWLMRSIPTTKVIFEEWLSGRGVLPATSESLGSVLQRLSLKLFHTIGTALTEYRGALTMDTLCNFRVVETKIESVNISREVGVKYLHFGTQLLQDVTGSHIASLEHDLKNSEDINNRILTEWLSGEGRPVTWDTLVEVLEIIGKGELAKSIKEKYITSSTIHNKRL